jgi:pyruvyl transferase EpsI
MNGVKCLIPLKYKQIYLKRKEQKVIKQKRQQFKEYIDSLRLFKKVFILDACDHRNLGDQAILMAEKKFLADYFREYNIITVGLNDFYNFVEIVKENISEDDLIFLHGGGNLGNEYLRAELIRRKIIELFPKNKIVLFPQTMFFKNDIAGKEELKQSIRVYGKHSNLTLIARETKSYELMKESFVKNKTLLTPDIVMYLNKTSSTNHRRGALFCCRRDVEGTLHEKDKEKIIAHLRENYSSLNLTDTVGENNFKAVEEKFEEFRSAEIVVTDRLHGMVFAAITGTPCIALSNYNYKVSGTYQWIKHLNYVKYAETIKQIPVFINELKKVKTTTYDNKFAMPFYKHIIDEVKS